RYCREQTKPKRVVTLVPDSGNKYLSKVFSDFWMAEQGLTYRKEFGDLRDLISRPFVENAVVSVSPEDTLTVAYARMRMYDISQLPVLEDAKLVGIIDESDLLLAASRQRDAQAFDRAVRQVMTSNVQTVARSAKIDELMPIFEAGRVAVVSDDLGFHGLI